MKTLTMELDVAGGSILGAEHRRTGRGNQDAWVCARRDGALVAVVADGCGSGGRTEVGAVLGARLWTRATLDALARGARPDDPRLWTRVQSDVVAHLAVLAGAMVGSRSELVSECFLFTIVCAAVTPERTAVVAVGDGLVVVNGDPQRLGPFEDNQPPYLGYALVGRAERVDIVSSIPTAELRSLVIGTDGASELGDDLTELSEDPRSFRNTDAIRRRLARLNRESVAIDWEAQRVERSHGRLADDTTVVVIRRRACTST